MWHLLKSDPSKRADPRTASSGSTDIRACRRTDANKAEHERCIVELLTSQEAKKDQGKKAALIQPNKPASNSIVQYLAKAKPPPAYGSPEAKEAATQAVCEAIVRCGLPFNVLNQPGFKNAFDKARLAGPEWAMPGIELCRSRVKQVRSTLTCLRSADVVVLGLC
jgi:hypothetical protein